MILSFGLTPSPESRGNSRDSGERRRSPPLYCLIPLPQLPTPARAILCTPETPFSLSLITGLRQLRPLIDSFIPSVIALFSLSMHVIKRPLHFWTLTFCFVPSLLWLLVTTFPRIYLFCLKVSLYLSRDLIKFFIFPSLIFCPAFGIEIFFSAFVVTIYGPFCRKFWSWYDSRVLPLPLFSSFPATYNTYRASFILYTTTILD